VIKKAVIRHFNLIVILLIFLFVGVLLTIEYSYKFDKDYGVDITVYEDNSINEKSSKNIKQNTIIEQEFTPEVDSFSMVRLSFTFEPKNEGFVYIKLYEKGKNKMLYEDQKKLSEIHNNGWFTDFDFNKNIKGIKGKKLVLELTFSKEVEDCNATMLLTEGKNLSNAHLFIDNKKQKENLKMVFVNRDSGFFVRYAYVFDAVLISMFISFFYYIFVGEIINKKMKGKANYEED